MLGNKQIKMRPLKNLTFYPIERQVFTNVFVSCSNFNPQNTKCIPTVNPPRRIAFLELEQKSAFFKGLKIFLFLFLWVSFFLLSGPFPVNGDNKKRDKILFTFPKKDAASAISKSKPSRKKNDQSVSLQRIETRYAVIRYETLKDLKKFDRKIDYSPGESSLKSLFSPSGSKNAIDSIKIKVEALFRRVQEILDMRGKIDKVNISLYRKKRFDAVYYRLAGIKRRVRAWYIFESKIIYLNIDDVHEGILAHEMAHHIIDHYLRVRPPRATAEILARYVDKHLHF